MINNNQKIYNKKIFEIVADSDNVLAHLKKKDHTKSVYVKDWVRYFLFLFTRDLRIQ